MPADIVVLFGEGIALGSYSNIQLSREIRMRAHNKRIKNLRELAGNYKSQSEFESEAGISKGYLSHIFSGKRGLGDGFCRKIEHCLGLKEGQLDQ